MKRWLVGGRIVDSVAGTVVEDTLCVENGQICSVGEPAGAGEILECEGRLIFPGFIDLHGLFRDLPGDARAARAGGFTTVVLACDEHHSIGDALGMQGLADRVSGLDVETVLPGALTVDVAGEAVSDIGLMMRAGCGVVSNGTRPIRNTRVLRNALGYAARFGIPVFLRPTDADLDDGFVKEGPYAVLLGLRGIPPEAEAIGVARITAMAKLTGAAVHLTHIWSAAGVDAVRAAKAAYERLTASTTIHHLALDEHIVDRTAYHGDARFHPPLGDTEDRAALLAGLRDGTIDAIATDHRPIAPHHKDLEFQRARPGSVGFQTALPLLRSVTDDPLEWCRWLTLGPARILGRNPPRLVPGARANLAIIDPDEDWEVSRATLASRANTPLVGQTVRGRVWRTLTNP